MFNVSIETGHIYDILLNIYNFILLVYVGIVSPNVGDITNAIYNLKSPIVMSVYPNNIVLTTDNFYIHAILNISYHFFWYMCGV